MKYRAIIEEEMLTNFRIDDPPIYMSESDKILVVKDELGYTRGIQLQPITEDKEITNWLIDNVFRNKEYYQLHDEETFYDMIWDLMVIIASLHNEYYKAVNGKYYDYMFHWVNKINGGSIDDDIFKRKDNKNNE